MIRFPPIVLLLLLFSWNAFTLKAHDPFESWSIARLRGHELLIQTTLSVWNVPDLIGEVKTVNLDDFESYESLVVDYAPDLFEVTIDENEPLKPIKVEVDYIEYDYDIQIRVTYERPERESLTLFDARYLEKLEDHVGTIYIENEEGVELGWSELSADYPYMEVTLPSIVVSADEPARPTPPSDNRFRKFLALGVEHILSGFDHLLFLAGLLIVCRRYATMAAIITCFTLAHSITLGLSVLDLFSIPGKIVEPLIAASIVYVGIENLYCRVEPKARWRIAFLFGLIHGFGFATALRQTGLGSSGTNLLVPLFSFNFGVELGQIVVAALFLSALWLLNKHSLFERYGPRALSIAVTGMGGYWLLHRTLFTLFR
jgi:hydrogenase/urease accessory protein HupE